MISYLQTSNEGCMNINVSPTLAAGLQCLQPSMAPLPKLSIKCPGYFDVQPLAEEFHDLRCKIGMSKNGRSAACVQRVWGRSNHNCVGCDVLHQPLPLHQKRSVQLGAALIARHGQRIPEVKNKLEKLCWWYVHKNQYIIMPYHIPTHTHTGLSNAVLKTWKLLGILFPHIFPTVTLQIWYHVT